MKQANSDFITFIMRYMGNNFLEVQIEKMEECFLCFHLHILPHDLIWLETNWQSWYPHRSF